MKKIFLFPEWLQNPVPVSCHSSAGGDLKTRPPAFAGVINGRSEKKPLRNIVKVALLFLLWAGSAIADDTATQTATFAGGCFWCMQSDFEGIDGVIKVVAGYTGGHTDHPTYEEVSSGTTGHVESIEVTYDPHKVSYQKLLDVFWDNVDPLDEYGQFCDKGSQYRAGIFTHNAEQEALAKASAAAAQKRFNQPLAVIIQPASTFWPAEDYHQDYYIKNRTRYKLYRYGCGRDARLDELHKQGQP